MAEARMRRSSGRGGMVRAALVAGCIALSAPVAMAQEDTDREALTERLEELPGQVEEALRGLIESIRPTIDQTLGYFDVLERIDSPEYYEKPVILPNGDILIRRDPDAPEWTPEEDPPEAQPEDGAGPQAHPDEGTRT